MYTIFSHCTGVTRLRGANTEKIKNRLTSVFITLSLVILAIEVILQLHQYRNGTYIAIYYLGFIIAIFLLFAISYFIWIAWYFWNADS